jgi:hypothetical protein
MRPGRDVRAGGCKGKTAPRHIQTAQVPFHAHTDIVPRASASGMGHECCVRVRSTGACTSCPVVLWGGKVAEKQMNERD